MTHKFATLEDITRTARRLNAGNAALPFCLLLMSDQQRLPGGMEIIAALPVNLAKNVAVIFRDYEVPNREALGQEWRRITKRQGMKLLVAGDAALAKHLQADGVHVPQWHHHQAKELRAKWPAHLLTASCHSEDDLAMLDGVGFDALLVSPVFPSTSHPGATAFTADSLAKITAAATTPIIGLGGINQYTHRQLKQTGLSGFAGISFFAKTSNAK